MRKYIKAELPDYFADKAALEIDFIPAQLADEDIETTELITENI